MRLLLLELLSQLSAVLIVPLLAGVLPLGSLAKLLREAAEMRPDGGLQRRGFNNLLCSVRAVNRHLRAAAELAMGLGQRPLELDLYNDQAPSHELLDSQLLATLGVLTLQLADLGGLSRAPNFQQLYTRSQQLVDICIAAHSSSSAAFAESAVCASTSVTRLIAEGWVPAQLPTQLDSLDVRPGRQAAENVLELLLIRAQRCATLSSVTLTVVERSERQC